MVYTSVERKNAAPRPPSNLTPRASSSAERTAANDGASPERRRGVGYAARLVDPSPTLRPGGRQRPTPLNTFAAGTGLTRFVSFTRCPNHAPGFRPSPERRLGSGTTN